MLEWCVLDAQWRGLAQRRKRVFVILDTGNWAGRPPILLEPKSSSGDHPPSRKAGQGVAGTISARTEGGGGLGTDFDLGGGLVPQPILVRMREGCAGGGKGPLVSEDQSLTLATSNDQVLSHDMSVRRLTPREAERLQGFQDDYTLIPLKRGFAKDGPRYKALGNSMATNVIHWIGERIEYALQEQTATSITMDIEPSGQTAIPDPAIGLERVGSFNHKGAWLVYRNKEGFLECYRTKSRDEKQGYTDGLTRRVTNARELHELSEYFKPVVKRTKKGLILNQPKIDYDGNGQEHL
jgi:hypothetical protein